jgi:transposase-like protein
MKNRRTFSPEERLSILQEGEREGQTATCRKYHLAPSLYLRWKKKYLEKSVDGLKPSYHRIDPEKRALEEENERLKKIIAKQALQIEVQGELFKKTPIQIKKR